MSGFKLTMVCKFSSLCNCVSYHYSVIGKLIFFALILGVPPLVSRRVLETLTYLARNHKFVANFLLQFRIPSAAIEESQNLDQARGKAVMIVQDDETEKQQYQEGLLAITLLLSLLKQPLYLRSIAHLEQVVTWRMPIC